MQSSIAFVGAGPTTIYTLHALIAAARGPFALTIFEQQASAGRGTPYRPGWNDPAMLSNIASIEIPPLTETLVAWLGAQPAERLTKLGIDPGEIGERVFYPRLALGDYLHDQFQALLDLARARGHAVEVRTRCRVMDAASRPDGMILTVRARGGRVTQERFDHVVLATGHQWPAEPEVRPGYFLSPWPASALATIPACAVGIRGTSLSAIDAAVALALRFGSFAEEADGRLSYAPNPGTDAFAMTMMSRKGLLPEADFFHPVPYEPLAICTAEAITAIAAAADEPLDEAFALFKQELAAADPDYADRIGLHGLSLEAFRDRYFAERGDLDPFDWAEWNLAEAKHNHAAGITVPWRYAILRMHEPMGLLVPHLDDEDFRRFSRYLKPVFVDDYATVPHESIERMLALHRAGKLDICAVGEEYRVESHREEGGAVVRFDGERLVFPAFIEATGQRPLGASDFLFRSLLDQGIVRDAPTSDPRKASRGIVIDDQFHPVSDAIPDDQLFCLGLPFLLGRHPFSQGITSSHEMGEIVGAQLAAAIERDGGTAAMQSAEAA